LLSYSKIKFEKIFPKNYKLIFDWRNTKFIREKMLNPKKISYKEHLYWCKNLKKDKYNQSYIIKYKNKKIGLISIKKIDKKNKTCTWGYYIAEVSYQYLALLVQLKFISWIFDKKNIKKIWGETLSNNKNILKIHKYFGFKVDGVIKKGVKINSKYVDIILTSLFRNEWNKNKKRIFSNYINY
tara:strand:+ start:1070 stop:1618 length:549 start_codon:yes stop_codon:yes gene_type:complete